MNINKSRLHTFQKLTPRDETLHRVSKIQDVIRVDKDSIWGATRALAVLYDLAAGYHTPYKLGDRYYDPRDGYCLELGTFRGGSASVMASALKDLEIKDKPLFTVDSYLPFPNHDDPAETCRFAMEAFRTLDVTDYVCQIIYNDLAFLRFWTLPTRLIYLDSNHSFKHTKEAIYMLMNKLMVNGWLALHDYIEGCGVLSALNQFLDEQTEYDLDAWDASGTLVCLHLKGYK